MMNESCWALVLPEWPWCAWQWSIITVKRRFIKHPDKSRTARTMTISRKVIHGWSRYSIWLSEQLGLKAFLKSVVDFLRWVGKAFQSPAPAQDRSSSHRPYSALLNLGTGIRKLLHDCKALVGLSLVNLVHRCLGPIPWKALYTKHPLLNTACLMVSQCKARRTVVMWALGRTPVSSILNKLECVYISTLEIQVKGLTVIQATTHMALTIDFTLHLVIHLNKASKSFSW